MKNSLVSKIIYSVELVLISIFVILFFIPIMPFSNGQDNSYYSLLNYSIDGVAYYLGFFVFVLCLANIALIAIQYKIEFKNQLVVKILTHLLFAINIILIIILILFSLQYGLARAG